MSLHPNDIPLVLIQHELVNALTILATPVERWLPGYTRRLARTSAESRSLLSFPGMAGLSLHSSTVWLFRLDTLDEFLFGESSISIEIHAADDRNDVLSRG